MLEIEIAHFYSSILVANDSKRQREYIGCAARLKTGPAENAPEWRFANSRESRPSLGSMLIAFIMFFTVLTVVALGVATTYGLVTGILFALDQSRQKARIASALVPSQSHASGD